MIKILFSLIIIILIVVLIIYKTIHYNELNILKKIDDIDIDVNDEDKDVVMRIVDNNVRKVLLRVMRRVISSLNRVYNNQEWENKRFLYNIISEISFLEISLKDNKLSELELQKISTIIMIIQVNKGYRAICDKVIFEWEKNYIE